MCQYSALTSLEDSHPLATVRNPESVRHQTLIGGYILLTPILRFPALSFEHFSVFYFHQAKCFTYLGVYNADEKEVSCLFFFCFFKPRYVGNHMSQVMIYYVPTYSLYLYNKTLRVSPQVDFSFSVNKVGFLAFLLSCHGRTGDVSVVQNYSLTGFLIQLVFPN